MVAGAAWVGDSIVGEGEWWWSQGWMEVSGWEGIEWGENVQLIACASRRDERYTLEVRALGTRRLYIILVTFSRGRLVAEYTVMDYGSGPRE